LQDCAPLKSVSSRLESAPADSNPHLPSHPSFFFFSSIFFFFSKIRCSTSMFFWRRILPLNLAVILPPPRSFGCSVLRSLDDCEQHASFPTISFLLLPVLSFLLLPLRSGRYAFQNQPLHASVSLPVSPPLRFPFSDPSSPLQWGRYSHYQIISQPPPFLLIITPFFRRVSTPRLDATCLACQLSSSSILFPRAYFLYLFLGGGASVAHHFLKYGSSNIFSHFLSLETLFLC